jgi:hypothetical protein
MNEDSPPVGRPAAMVAGGNGGRRQWWPAAMVAGGNGGRRQWWTV